MKWRYPFAHSGATDGSNLSEAQVPGHALERWVSLAIALGTLLRVFPYLRNRSLWYDEALLALNILQRPFSRLLDPLDYHQGAPLGFLLIEKLATKLIGRSEYALRFLPLLFGIGALFLFWQVALACLSRRAVPLALLLFAINEPLIYYSSEVKQYSCDVAVTLFLLWAVLRLMHSKLPARSVFGFGLMGAVAIWFSHPASFLLAGSGVALIALSCWRKHWASLFRIACVLAMWSASFALCYVWSLRKLGEDQVLVDFWRNYFPPQPLLSAQAVLWFVGRGLAVLGDPRNLATVFAAGLFVAGCGAFILKQSDVVWLIASACIMTLLASLVHRYPLAERLLLFAVPMSLLGVAEGAIWIADRFLRSATARVGLIALLLAHPVWIAARSQIVPRRPDHIRPAIRYIQTHQRPGDSWYVYSLAQYQFRYYADLYNLRAENVHVGTNCAEDLACYQSDLENLQKPSRVWVLFSHIVVRDRTDEEQILLSQLDKIGVRLDENKSPGARAYLYDLSAGAAKPVLPSAPTPADR
jgi:hypothetical protein